MKRGWTISLAASLLLAGSTVYGYDEGGSSPYTVKFGYKAGEDNNGSYNTFIGRLSGYYNTTGEYNTFVGHGSGYSNTDGDYNTFIGRSSGFHNTDGHSNTFVGQMSGYSNTDGNYNTFIGRLSGRSNTDGHDNTFVGQGSGYSNTGGDYNTFIGRSSGYHNTDGGYNTFIGRLSGYNNTTGGYNTFLGHWSGYRNTTGGYNTFVGRGSGYSNTTGRHNTFLGRRSGYSNTDGEYNTFIGLDSGYNADVNTSVFLGYQAGFHATRNNTLYIANSDTSDPLIYGEFDTGVVKINGDLNTTGPVTASFSGYTDKQALKMMDIRVNNTNDDKKSDVGFQMTNVREDFAWTFRTWEPDKGFAIAKVGNGATKEFRLYDSTEDDATSVVLELANGAYCDGVWHDTSSRTMKRDIKELDAKAAMEAFKKLRPVTYAYKSNPSDPKVGFIAEEVPDLVADPGRRSLSPMDMVALLTKVVQVQEKRLSETKAELKRKEREMAAMRAEIANLKKMQAKISRLESLLTNLALKSAPGASRLSRGE